MEFKKDYTIKFLCILALVGSVLFVINLPMTSLTEVESIMILPLTLLILIAHEVAHFLTIKRFGKYARITTFLKRGSLMVEYDTLTVKEYIIVSLAPLIFIQLPLTAGAYITSNPCFIILSVLHIMGSLVDIFYSFKLGLTCRECSIQLYRENGKVKGYVLIKPNGEKTIYLI